jgi:hypothetical protein
MPWGDHTLPYVYERQWLTRKFPDLAAANISIIEHHRYDPTQVLYDVADEMGVFVVGANFCVGTGQVPRGETTEAEKALIIETHLAVADNCIRRSRNHPSILFWDVTDARDPDICLPLLRKGTSVSGAQVFVRAMDGQGLSPFGGQADEAGRSWFVLPEPGRYRFECGEMWIEVEAICQPLVALPGYDHVQREWLELCYAGLSVSDARTASMGSSMRSRLRKLLTVE